VKKELLTTRIRIAQVNVPFHFSFNAKRLSRALLDKYETAWYPAAEHMGECIDSVTMEAKKNFVAVWVNRGAHKNDIDILQTINHEIEHASRKVMGVYGEEHQGAEETTIRVSDDLRDKVYKFLKVVVMLG